ncbi:hypothetical protein [Anabaena catenula]|nr:hypothetical protein [Anabaena catenula]
MLSDYILNIFQSGDCDREALLDQQLQTIPNLSYDKITGNGK